MMSGVATIVFLLVVQGRVPSYLGTSAAFVGAVVAIRAAGSDTATVTGAILVAGAVLAVVGVVVHVLGAPSSSSRCCRRSSPARSCMLIGFNLAPVVATVYWPQDQWVALIVDVRSSSS